MNTTRMAKPDRIFVLIFEKLHTSLLHLINFSYTNYLRKCIRPLFPQLPPLPVLQAISRQYSLMLAVGLDLFRPALICAVISRLLGMLPVYS